MIKKQTGQEFFKTAAVLGTLCIGGFVVMIPMKMMEDNKRIIAEYLDNNVIDPINGALGKGPKTKQEKQELQETRHKRYAEMDEEPSQTWGSMLCSRVTSLIPLYALHMAWWNKNNVIKYADGLINNLEITNPSPEHGFGGVGYYSNKFGTALGDGIYDKVLPNAAKSAMDKPWFSEKVDWAVMDVLYSLVAATGTLQCTKIFGKMFDKSHEEKDVQETENSLLPNPLVVKAEHNGSIKDGTKELQFAY